MFQTDMDMITSLDSQAKTSKALSGWKRETGFPYSSGLAFTDAVGNYPTCSDQGFTVAALDLVSQWLLESLLVSVHRPVGCTIR
jgi:hypothetical protein